MNTAMLRFFVRESNRIEGITRPPRNAEFLAHLRLLQAPELTVAVVAQFVATVANAELRIRDGMNVRVGNHRPPPGGSGVGYALKVILDHACEREDPYEVHQAYEDLHPFMDGNGRSGRAIWLWQMLNQHGAEHALRMGFLHLFYYQALSHHRVDAPHSNRTAGGG